MLFMFLYISQSKCLFSDHLVGLQYTYKNKHGGNRTVFPEFQLSSVLLENSNVVYLR